MTTPNSEGLPPEVQQRLDRLDELERAEAERKGEYQRLSESQKTKHASELAKRDEQIGKLNSALLRSTAERAIRDKKGDVDSLMPHVLPLLELRETGRDFDIVVRDETGRPRQSVRDRGHMSIDDFVDELKDHHALGRLFEGAGPRGEFRVPSEKEIRLNEAESKDPRLYQRLKERKAKGEISTVYDHVGRRLL